MDVVREAEGRTGQPEEARIGGAVSFAAVTAVRLGYSVGLITSAAADFPFDALRAPCAEAGPEHEACHALPPSIAVVNVASDSTTRFANRYAGGRREQRVLSRAADLDAPRLLHEAGFDLAPVVFVAPLVGEVPTECLAAFRGSLLGVGPQGWLRAWDSQGVVRRAPWPRGRTLVPAEVAVVSEEDLDAAHLPVEWELVRLLAVTQGQRGARFRLEGAWWQVPAFPAREVDPTGAGDVFAAALLLRLGETRDPLEAAAFASATAALSVEGEGLSAVPCRRRVDALMHGHPQIWPRRE